MNIKIGRVVFSVLNLDDKTELEIKDFATEQTPELQIDLAKTNLTTQTGEADKSRYLFAQITEYLYSKGVVRIHSSAVEYNGKAYAFGAPSGTGKSTHARLWVKYVNAEYVNDDQPFYSMQKPITVYSSPWAGKHGKFNNVNVPLGGFVIIKQSKTNSIKKIDKKTAVYYLYKQIVQPKEKKDREKLLEFIQHIVDNVPFYLLQCDKSKQAFTTCFNAITGEQYED